MRLGLIQINMGPMSRPTGLLAGLAAAAAQVRRPAELSAPNVLNPRFHGV